MQSSILIATTAWHRCLPGRMLWRSDLCPNSEGGRWHALERVLDPRAPDGQRWEMSDDSRPSECHHEQLVELTRVQPFEAEVIAARLRASGIQATLGSGSVYESISFAAGVPVFVPAEDVSRASALLDRHGEPD